jgi:hypothetical protein
VSSGLGKSMSQLSKWNMFNPYFILKLQLINQNSISKYAYKSLAWLEQLNLNENRIYVRLFFSCDPIIARE